MPRRYLAERPTSGAAFNHMPPSQPDRPLPFSVDGALNWATSSRPKRVIPPGARMATQTRSIRKHRSTVLPVLNTVGARVSQRAWRRWVKTRLLVPSPPSIRRG